MKVAVVTQGFARGGGIASVSRWLVDGLQEHGHSVEVHVLSSSSTDKLSRRVTSPSSLLRSPRAEYSEPSDWPPFTTWGANLAEFEPARYTPRSALTRRLNRCDVVQIVAGAPCAALVARKVEPPVLLQVATTTRWERASRFSGMSFPKRAIVQPLSQLVYLMDRRGVRVPEHVFVENHEMEQWVKANGQDRVTLAPPGVDCDSFCPAGPWKSNGPIISLGRLSEPRKGWARLIRAYDLLAARSPSVPPLIIAGTGKLATRDQRSLENSPNAARISVLPNLSTSAVASVLRSGSVFLQASYEEGLGIAGLEAMASGLPMVATDTAGTRMYLIDGVNGVLVAQAGNVSAALADGLARVLFDPRGDMSVHARRTAIEGFSQRARLGVFLAAYQRLLTQSGMGE